MLSLQAYLSLIYACSFVQFNKFVFEDHRNVPKSDKFPLQKTCRCGSSLAASASLYYSYYSPSLSSLSTVGREMNKEGEGERKDREREKRGR